MVSKHTIVVPLVVATSCGAPNEPRFGEPMVLGGAEVSAATLNQGHRLYTRYCASCHGVDGSGQGPAAVSLAHAPRDFRKAQFMRKSTPGAELPSHADLVGVIRDGWAERGMPSWRGLRGPDLDALAHYVKTFSGAWSGG